MADPLSWKLPIGEWLAAIVVFVLGVLALGLVTCGCSGSSKTTARAAIVTAQCAERYAACVATSETMTAYLACRARVDSECLPVDGGAP